jgi:signal peptidase II
VSAVDGPFRPRWLLVGVVAAATLAADQLSKLWVLNALADHHVIPVVWTLQLALHENTGAAFSMGRDSTWVKFMPLLVLVAVGVVVWRSRSLLTRPAAVSVGLIVGGAVGNLLDRAFRTDGGGFLSGGVVDFIDVQWWPVFNVADMGVVVGSLLFALLAVGGPREPAGDGGDGGDEGSGEAADPADPAARMADADTSS